MTANKYCPCSLFHRVYLQFWKDAGKAARERKITLITRTHPLPTILSVYVLSSYAIAFPNLTPVPRGLHRLHVKVTILRTRLSRVPHLPGVPHFHVNRLLDIIG